ncbi:hypothetical protein QRD02_12515, partial [Aequorivita sp. SDUM287046]|nr:hypothetical protein [Aequorivita aurantiaca]
MKKLLLLFILCTSSLFAQVGIGTVNPDPASQLEITSSNRGVLIPRLALTDVSDQTTITAGNVESLLVYNTTENSSLTRGYYYWYQGKWHRLISKLDLPDNIVIWDPVNNQFTYIDENGNVQIIDINDLIEETLTTLTDNGDGTISYTDEQGNTTIIDIRDLETLTSLMLSADGQILEYKDEAGVTTQIDVAALVQNLETVTSLINHNNGVYDYTSEDNTITTIDVIADVVNNIQNQGDIYTAIINLINSNSTTDIFVDNGDGTFTHTAADGTVVMFDANTLTFVNNGNGSYTFTNENGETLTIDVIADVVTNIQNQGDIYNEIISIINSTTDIFVDNGDGTFTHTAADG